MRDQVRLAFAGWVQMRSSGVPNRLEIEEFRTLCNPPSPLTSPTVSQALGHDDSAVARVATSDGNPATPATVLGA
jgi:hypothetical protein